jgi:hypothetical protein
MCTLLKCCFFQFSFFGNAGHNKIGKMRSFRELKSNLATRGYFSLKTGVARWFLFKPKIPIWVNFGGR